MSFQNFVHDIGQAVCDAWLADLSTAQVMSDLRRVGEAIDDAITEDVVPAIRELAMEDVPAMANMVTNAYVDLISTSLSSLLSTATIPIENLSDHLSLGENLDPDSDMYGYILEYINNSQERSHEFGIKVKNIMSIERRNNLGFQRFRGHGRKRMMLWHGTSVDNLSSIITGGFRLPPPDRTNLLQGRGIYCADRASKSAHYCDGMEPEQDGILILCEVIVGRSHIQYREGEATSNYDRTCPPDGFDSVLCPGKRIRSESKRINGVIFPMGESRGHKDHRKCLVNYTEYIVYDPDQIDVKYVVTFTFTRRRYINKN